MKRTFKRMMSCIAMIAVSLTAGSQLQAQDNTAQSADISAKAKTYIDALNLGNTEKQQRLEKVVSQHLASIRDWHNAHPASTVPAGINPVTGNKLSELDRQIIADSAIPVTVHQELMDGLRKDLSPEQVELVLDKYTIGKVAFTMKGYQAIVPDLKPEESDKILGFLKEAREMAVDYKNMKQISAIFEIYKTKAEQYLNNNGRSWRALYADYTKKIKAEKAAKKQ